LETFARRRVDDCTLPYRVGADNDAYDERQIDMAVLSATTKTKAAAKAAKIAVANPRPFRVGARAARPVGKVGFKATKPLAKRRARQRVEDLGQAARSARETAVVYGPRVAYALGLVEVPKRKPMTPFFVAGIVIGASAMYFLDTGRGGERRRRVAQLVT
jgi:hypothetical protein